MSEEPASLSTRFAKKFMGKGTNLSVELAEKILDHYYKQCGKYNLLRKYIEESMNEKRRMGKRKTKSN